MYIVLRNLSANGFSWKLSAIPLVIGRGQECDIRVFDSELSRRHAKVWLDGEIIRFQDLGSSNATLANGKPRLVGTLKPGDTLGLGSTIFLIAESPETIQAEQTADSALTPITISARIESYRAKPGESAFVAPTHRTVNELHDLFQLGRALGTVESVRELSLLLERTLREKFEPDALWIAWRYADEQPLLWEEIEQPGNSGAPPQSLLSRALDTREGVVTPANFRDGRHTGPQTMLAVPLVHADQALGGFALSGCHPGRIYAEDDLHYALGIASITAPHVRAVRHAEQLRRDNQMLRSRAGTDLQLLGESPAIRTVRELLARAGNSNLPVLILGETGTGKEIAARVLHDASPRREGPYITVNCAAIPADLFESEFFGFEKGAFTGATTHHFGRFAEAHGGTLFLDEIGDLSLDNQARILRVIETNTYHRIGSSKPVQVDVRIIAATNKTLAEPAFRLDLFHRLNGVTVTMPPLRERAEDVPILANHFLRHSSSHGPVQVRRIHATALAHLQEYAWPGNVRELKAFVDRAIVFAQGPELTVEDFPLDSVAFAVSHSPGAQSCDDCDTSPLVSLAEIEREHILRVLKACDGNIAAAARILQTNRATLYRRLAEYGVS